MQKSVNRKFAFIINYGIEYRMFFISGLLHELSKEHEVLVIKRDVDNTLFDEYQTLYGFKTLVLEKKYFEKKRSKIENIFQSIRQSRLKHLGKTPFKNYNIKINDLTWKDILKGNVFTFKLLKFITLKSIVKQYSDDSLSNILKENKVTDIVMSGYSSTGNISFAVNSLKEHIKVWSFINSWKDFYINDFLPFQANTFFVWSDQMKKDFLTTNDHINQDSIISSGNIVFDRFYNPEITFHREYYESKYDFKTNDKVFLYCMLDPDRYENEKEIILLISKELNNVLSNFKILVKKNPFDSTNRVNEFFKDKDIENVAVLEHFSQRDKENDFFIQSIDGEKEWIDILDISDYVLGAASTVALEAIMMKKNVITIGFDKHGEKDNFLISLSEIDFYKELLERDDTVVSTNIKDLITKLQKSIVYDSEHKTPTIIGKFDGQAKTHVLGVMYNG